MFSTPEKSAAITPQTTPTTELPSLTYPAGFTERDFVYADENCRVVVLSNDANRDLLECFQDLNPDRWKCFFLLGRKLFFEDQLGNESLIHESFVESIQSAVGQVGYAMAQRSGMSAAKIATWCGKMVSGVGVPDLAVCSLEKFQVFDPVMVVEIAYFATLRTTYEKVIAYFDAVPRIQAALIIDVGYPWGRVGGAGTSFLDPNHSKLVLVYLRRQPNNTVVAETVISFGNTPLTAADVERIVDVTGA